MTHGLTSAPITGHEELGDRSLPAQALAEFYKAFNTRDLPLMAENWEPSEEAAMDNPVGGITRGWADIRSVYERIFSSPAQVRVAFHDYTLHVGESMFYAVGRERGRFVTPAGALDLRIRHDSDLSPYRRSLAPGSSSRLDRRPCAPGALPARRPGLSQFHRADRPARLSRRPRLANTRSRP